jgi:Domain of unknown function (DUF4149)
VPFLRFLMLLSLVVWVGGLIFFPVVAQTAFGLLFDAPHLAGLVVRTALLELHWMGIVSGIVFLFSSVAHEWLRGRSPRLWSARNVLVACMLALTLTSQFEIIPRMERLRTSVRDFSSVLENDPVRVSFNALHAWSTGLEAGVLLLGLIVVGIMSGQLARDISS